MSSILLENLVPADTKAHLSLLVIQVQQLNTGNMKSLERLGLKLKEPIALNELLSESFNPRLHGLTKAQEEKINALRDVVARYMSVHEDAVGKIISGSKEAVEVASSRLRTLQHEELWVAYLNKSNLVISFDMLFKGSLDSVVISHRDIIAQALSKGASNIIIYHNHPSGNPTPGLSDIEQTRQLSKACKLMQIQLLDHIIISSGSFYSFTDEQTCKFNSKS